MYAREKTSSILSLHTCLNPMRNPPPLPTVFALYSKTEIYMMSPVVSLVSRYLPRDEPSGKPSVQIPAT